MRTVHALATHHRPLSDSTWLCVLHRKNGLDVPEEFSTRRAAKVFAHHIAEVGEGDMLGWLGTQSEKLNKRQSL